ncbi:MAG: CAP domain-containing protein, partial [Nanoarchaeota archaeon]
MNNFRKFVVIGAGYTLVALAMANNGRTGTSCNDYVSDPSQISQARTMEVNSEVEELFSLINDYRRSHDVPQLRSSAALTDIADWMATDMVNNDYFSHTDSQGRNPFERMDENCYKYNTWEGENLAMGASSAIETLD